VAKNEEKYQNYIRPMALNYKNLEKIEREQVKKFFLTNVIGDEQRKELWTLKIGNRLKINKTIYENLVERLKYEDFEPKIEKLIKDDLNRTLPVDPENKAGGAVYEEIRNLLKVWHIYRPEIGYTQGMAYYVCLLYSYFDEYNTFKLFSNLVIGRDVVYSLYSFNKTQVSF
jgi:hypothetical protein